MNSSFTSYGAGDGAGLGMIAVGNQVGVEVLLELRPNTAEVRSQSLR